MNKYAIAFLALALSFNAAAQLRENPQSKSFRYSQTIEKERPELNEATKKLIAAYRKNPTEENKAALREQIARNYEAVLDRKKAKLAELRQTARHQSKITEMEEIVAEMERDRENRINQSLARFTDARLKPGVRQSADGFLPILGAAQNVAIAYTEVSNGEYAEFAKATGRAAPPFSESQKDLPVVNVSYNDAVAYCEWLSAKNPAIKYRLPTEKEWEQAAGHMPKDADFNNGENKGLQAVTAYSKTLSASGAINMWGNAWEWTSTARADGTQAVKGGAWDSPRMQCRTENREEGRAPQGAYDNVGFRVLREGDFSNAEPRERRKPKPRDRREPREPRKGKVQRDF